MSQEKVLSSTRGAAAILSAWRENDVQCLERSLAAASHARGFVGIGPGEHERLELLSGIAERISSLVASGHLDDVNVYLPLLRHLSAPTMPWAD